MFPEPSDSPLTRYLSGLAEHVFQTRLGIADPSVSDYISDLLIRFTRTDQLQPKSSLTGRRLRTLRELLDEAHAQEPDSHQLAHRQVGDHALFWVGLYPEALKKGQPGQLEHYRGCGKRAYLVASQCDKSDVPAGLLARLSDQFDTCAEGLLSIRDHWHESSGPGPGFLSA